jgi:hypothetical protein
VSGALPDLVVFGAEDTGEVVARMRDLQVDRSGWINVDPEVTADDLERAPRTGGIFSGRGPAVPELSWVPGRPGRRGIPPVSIGVRHASGPKLVDRLAGDGHPVPADWDVVDDSPRRGLVARLPEGADPDEVLTWLLHTGELVTAVPLTGRWRASIHRYV